MQRIILTYGIIAGAIVVASTFLAMALGIHSMVFGYLSMLIALSMVFVGVKRYRDQHLGGVIRFWTALGVGFGIALIASLLYALGWEIYLYATDYSFMTDYIAGATKAMRAQGASAEEIAKFTAEMQGFADSYRNPVTRILITVSEIAPVALIATVISAAALRNRNFLPAR